MNDRDLDRAEAVRQIAAILGDAYVRLRFPELLQKEVDCAENGNRERRRQPRSQNSVCGYTILPTPSANIDETACLAKKYRTRRLNLRAFWPQIGLFGSRDSLLCGSGLRWMVRLAPTVRIAIKCFPLTYIRNGYSIEAWRRRARRRLR